MPSQSWGRLQETESQGRVFTAVWLCHRHDALFSTCFSNKEFGLFLEGPNSLTPCHAQHTKINLICFPLSQTALQPVWGKAFLTVKLAGTRPSGLKQRKETKKLCLWNSVPRALQPGDSHRSQMPSSSELSAERGVRTLLQGPKGEMGQLCWEEAGWNFFKLTTNGPLVCARVLLSI